MEVVSIFLLGDEPGGEAADGGVQKKLPTDEVLWCGQCLFSVLAEKLPRFWFVCFFNLFFLRKLLFSVQPLCSFSCFCLAGKKSAVPEATEILLDSS